MEKKALGKSGIRVSPLALGGNVFGWTIDEQTSFKVLDAFVDCGLNLIDTGIRWETREDRLRRRHDDPEAIHNAHSCRSIL